MMKHNAVIQHIIYHIPILNGIVYDVFTKYMYNIDLLKV